MNDDLPELEASWKYRLQYHGGLMATSGWKTIAATDADQAKAIFFHLRALHHVDNRLVTKAQIQRCLSVNDTLIGNYEPIDSVGT